MTSFPAPVRAERLLASLTEEQRAAVEASDTTVHVRAGPGSGKTRVLAARVIYLHRVRRVPLADICVFVFSNAAADEIRNRIVAVLGPEVADQVWVKTFHAYAARLAVPPGWEIAAPDFAEDAIQAIYKGPDRLGPRHQPLLTVLRDTIARTEAGVATTDPVADYARKRVLYQLGKTCAIPMWALAPLALLAPPTRRWSHVIVDESQDCTPVEAELAAQACDGALMTLGDPRQAIFDWRYADHGAMQARRPGVELTLSRSFRFGPEVAELANRVAHAAGMAADVVGYDGLSIVRDGALEDPAWRLNPSRTAVLCRTHDECHEVAEQLGEIAHHLPRREAWDPECADRFAEVSASGRIVVSTIHAAKGREWDSVFVAGAGVFPRQGAEDLRCLYVAITRAKFRLTIGRLSETGRKAMASSLKETA